MSFVTPDYQAIRDAILRDIANQVPDSATGEDSDFRVRSNATGAAIEGLYQHQAWIARQVLPDTADREVLERHASLRGITRKTATAATGTIHFTGTAGASIPIGTAANTSAGVGFVTTSAGTLDGTGNATVAAQASVAGSAGNQLATTALTLNSAPAGVQSAAMITTMTGGTDVETDDALRARLLFVLRNPPQGGAKHDYYIWAMEVDGVANAYPYPLRRGLGTVDVVIVTTGGVPGAPLIASVQSHINTVAPITADCLVLGPTGVSVAVTAALTLSGITLAEATSAITAVLQDYFASLAPGDTVRRNRIGALIADVSGVVDYTLTAPAANVTTSVDATHVEMPVLGVVTLT